MQLPLSTTCGIIYNPDESDSSAEEDHSPTLYLPLERVAVDAEIVDVSAVVIVTQFFWQYLHVPNAQAKYVFPVPSRAAVCGFEMRIKDGRIVKAVCKDKDEASREYDAAIKAGKMSGLVEHITDDIFSISLGALPDRQMVTTELTYAMDLMDADLTDQVRFQLPVCVGVRFGELPPGMAAAQLVPSERVEITANVTMYGTIRSISSPTHTGMTSGGGTPADALPAQPRTIQCSARFLQEDFVLVIKADGLDASQNLNLPPLPAQEYIFLVDRSGSMTGDRIETAKKAHVMLLRALPAQGTTFNIFSIGNSCDSIWGECVQYSESSLVAATQYVHTMHADYGGTEIRGALESVFKSRNLSVPTSSFILTDGEAYNVKATLDTVSTAVGAARFGAPIRVFTLGFGETTSTEMCEGIARRGNGICLLSSTSESIIAKCSKLVRASRTHILSNVSVDWGTGLPQASTGQDMLDQSFRQSPSQITSLYSGCRFTVFAIIKLATFVLPDNITIRAQPDGQGPIMTLTAPVQHRPFTPDKPQLSIIHTLAARRMIRVLEDDNEIPFVQWREAIATLGTTYQVVSRYTSFVAVDSIAGLSDGSERQESSEQCIVGMSAALASIHPVDEESDEDMGFEWAGSGDVGVSLESVSATADEEDTGEDEDAGEDDDEDKGDDEDDADIGFGVFDDGNCSLENTEADHSVNAAIDEAEQLIRLQSFDGSFHPFEQLEKILGRAALAKAADINVDGRIWATILAIAYLQKYLKGQVELLEGLVEKAQCYVSQVPDVDFEGILQQARELIV